MGGGETKKSMVKWIEFLAGLSCLIYGVIIADGVIVFLGSGIIVLSCCNDSGDGG